MNLNLTKSILTLMLLTATLGFGFAQGVVKGVVIDASSGETLVGATITVEGTTAGTASLFDGSFSLLVPKGKQKVIIGFIGYTSVVKEVELNNDLNLGKILLNPESIGLEEIMVVASIARDRQTPVAVSTIKAEVIV
ncbi:MAG: carboxypeptidase-like regulatory domain-containing protein, partial [Bacteroidales bacterium]|nr:carboxypeptidase-like regulatory domain-containing protein [Bacteroidales bacterium]